MLDAVREWIMGVTATAVLVALAGLFLRGGVLKKLGRLTGGLVLMLAVLHPLGELDEGLLSSAMSEVPLPTGRERSLEKLGTQALEALIEARTRAYILDETGRMGLACQVEVETQESGDYPVPWAVTIRGTLSEDDRELLTRKLCEELDIPRERQTYLPGGEA